MAKKNWFSEIRYQVFLALVGIGDPILGFRGQIHGNLEVIRGDFENFDFLAFYGHF